mgnify:CR=1 FL=1
MKLIKHKWPDFNADMECPLDLDYITRKATPFNVQGKAQDDLFFDVGDVFEKTPSFFSA